ncbi:hypothetical protein BJ165DRAFT_902393 [Panaeolus papilionaceus]|nr:hypothetical protein BJ165DRAFT_902393 [Panaeolus papilionaceus]
MSTTTQPWSSAFEGYSSRSTPHPSPHTYTPSASKFVVSISINAQAGSPVVFTLFDDRTFIDARGQVRVLTEEDYRGFVGLVRGVREVEEGLNVIVERAESGGGGGGLMRSREATIERGWGWRMDVKDTCWPIYWIVYPRCSAVSGDAVATHTDADADVADNSDRSSLASGSPIDVTKFAKTSVYGFMKSYRRLSDARPVVEGLEEAGEGWLLPRPHWELIGLAEEVESWEMSGNDEEVERKLRGMPVWYM